MTKGIVKDKKKEAERKKSPTQTRKSLPRKQNHKQSDRKRYSELPFENPKEEGRRSRETERQANPGRKEVEKTLSPSSTEEARGCIQRERKRIKREECSGKGIAEEKGLKRPELRFE